MFEEIAKLIAEHLDINVSDIKPESDFVTDLDADSLDIVEMLIELENTYGLEFEESEMQSVKTVGDVIKFIETRKSK